MIDDMTQMIKEKLLQDLIDKMSDAHGDRMKPRGLGVEIAAPDKEGLADGLDKAKSMISKADPSDEAPADGDADDDERRLMELLENDDDDDEAKGH